MPLKDYYVILGISPDETQSGVQNAWRDLARRYHPDRAGQQSTRQFQEVSEAYNVLGDPGRRADYDRQRGRPAKISAGESVAAWKDVPPEPFDSGETHYRRRASPELGRRLSVLEDFVASHPAFDEILDGFRKNFSDAWLPKSRRLDALNLVLHLSPAEAWRGGTVELGVPVFFPCPHCHGEGRVGYFYACPQCHETGTIMREEPVRLRIPPRIADGTLYDIPLKGLGIENFFLRVLIRVDG